MSLQHYFLEILPALAIGFLLSGLINEFIPTSWVERHLGEKGIKPIFYSTIVGTIAPVCCWGSLPLAVTFYIKGASLRSVLALLVATPATSVNALIVVWKFFGIMFTLYAFFSVIVMGIVTGVIGNLISPVSVRKSVETCPHCNEPIQLRSGLKQENHICKTITIVEKIKSVLEFAYIDMPKRIGLETLAGIALAALVNTVAPVGLWIKNYLYGAYGYLFAVVFGLIMYMCATMSVPLVYALVNQGLNIGAGLTLLLIGPITSYGTILVIRKEFGNKTLLIYLGIISLVSLLSGYLFSILQTT